MKKRLYIDSDSSISEIYPMYNFGKSSDFEVSNYLGDIARGLFNFKTDLESWFEEHSSSEFINESMYELHLINSKHPLELEDVLTYEIAPLTKAWEEGPGWNLTRDIIVYSSSFDEVNWYSASHTESWSTAGGDYDTSSILSYTTSQSAEDIVLGLTNNISESYATYLATGSFDFYGYIIKLSSSYEEDTELETFKRFYSKQSETVYSPYVEMILDDYVYDSRYLFIHGENNYLYSYNSANLVNPPILKIKEPNSGSVVATYTSEKIKTGTYKSQLIDTYPSGSEYFTASWCYSASGIEIENYTCSIETQSVNNFKLVTSPIIKKDVYESYSIDDNIRLNYIFEFFTPGEFYYDYMRDAISDSGSCNIYRNIRYSSSIISVYLEPDILIFSDTMSYDHNGYYYNLDSSWLFENQNYTINIKASLGGYSRTFNGGKFFLKGL